MKVKDIVFNEYHGIRRYGVVVDKYMKDNWAYVIVDWVDDTLYERAMNWTEQLGQGDKRLYEYRVNQVKRIDAPKELEQLRMCIDIAKE